MCITCQSHACIVYITCQSHACIVYITCQSHACIPYSCSHTYPYLFPQQLSVRAVSDANKVLPSSVARCKRRERQRSLSESEAIHLYSSQKFNSTELGQAKVREKLDPRYRYTFSQQYHSMTVVPIDVEALERAKRSAELLYYRVWREACCCFHICVGL